MLNLNPALWFADLPHEWAVFLLSMIPITEIRASIPIGIEVYGLPVWKVWVIGVLGDILPAAVILLVLNTLREWLVEHRILGPIITRFLNRAERKFSGKYAKYGAIALIAFVGIPLPFTGSWTGSFAAAVFHIPFKKALPLITVGVCVAATIITLITLFASGVIGYIL